jgi:Flp pilus assembly protein TadD/uncharacterized caspase-like protein
MRYVGRIFCLLALCFQLSEGLGQRKEIPPPDKPSRGLHALVVGISQYQSKAIPALQFADKDARLFSEFLQTEAGGNMDRQNLTLLLNGDATFSAIYQAMFALISRVQKNDTVYFYFSGHGDVENQTVFNLGYLLGYDSPPNNYINHAVRIEDINNFANTLSARNNAKVILITDACRSGKLAGDMIGGRRLISTHLLKAQRNEIRLASCGPDELSVENQGWGGGRGVFSYYLLQALQGLAVAPPQQVVSGKDLQTFMANAFKQDKILQRDGHKQTPVITGNLGIALSKPTEQSISLVKQSQEAQQKMPTGLAALSTSREIPLTPQAYVVNQIKSKGIDKIIDFRRPVTTSPQQFATRVLDAVGATDDPFGEQHPGIVRFRELLKSDAVSGLRFNEQLAQLICEQGQQAILQYLKSDWVALEERQYYNMDNGDFLRYAHMFQYVLQLIPADHYLYRSIQTDYFYFLGTFNRMQQFISPNDSALLPAAKMALHQALKTEPYAPYVHNELGNVFTRLKNQDSALYHYSLAAELAPTWAIPLANLVGVYYMKEDLVSARSVAEKAMALQPTLFNLLVNKGLVEEKVNNRLHAMELYQQAISQNPAHYLPYERLGMVFTTTAQYAKADSFFFEANKKKLGYNLPPDADMPILAFSGRQSPPPEGIPKCYPDTDASLGNLYEFHLALGYRAWQIKDDAKAESFLKEAFRVGGHQFFLTNHYLGLVYYRQENWVLAAHYLKRAKLFYLDEPSFNSYPGYLHRRKQGTADVSCLVSMLKEMYYQSIEDNFLLAEVYHQLGYYQDAVAMYEEVLLKNSTLSFSGGYYLLAALHEKYGKWEAAENTWIRYSEAVRKYETDGMGSQTCFKPIYTYASGQFELQQFYERVTNAYPEHALWHRKAASFYYESYAYRSEDEIESDPQMESSEYGMIANMYENKRSSFINCFLNMPSLPGINRKINFFEPVRFPYRRGLDFFAKAIHLNAEEEVLQSLYMRYAGYLALAGKTTEVADALTKVLEVSPEDASLRNRVIDAYKHNQNLHSAYLQMDLLKSKNQLLPDKYLNYANLAMLSGDFKKANQAFMYAKEIHIDSSKQLALLQANLAMLEGNSALAITLLNELAKEQPEDYHIRYSLVRMYAAAGNHEQAIASMKRAFDLGFPYGYLLAVDPAMHKLREDTAFKNLYESKISYIGYKD